MQRIPQCVGSIDGVNVPGYWDTGIARLVVPYAALWHNQDDWPVGHKTTIHLYNQSGQSVTMTTENHLWSGVHGDSLLACANNNEGEIERNDTLAPAETQRDVDAFNFVVLDTVRAQHDTALFFRLNPQVGGMGASATISPNSSGSRKNCAAPSCP